MGEVAGVVIDSGPSDWQIFQQEATGCANIRLAGRWAAEGKARGVELRLVCQDTGVVPSAGMDWQSATMHRDGTWSAGLRGVPAGGLYRLETRMWAVGPDGLAEFRGDMRHCLGVGDLWVIAGQSNSSGYGQGPCHDPPELGVHVLNNAMRWALGTHPLSDSTDIAHPANRGTRNGGHAPWLHWAQLIKRAMGFPIGLIQTSLGGSPLVTWNPTEPGEHPLYETMLEAVAGAGGKVRGILWYQGCTDATEGTGTATTYRRRFTGAVRAWRKGLKSPRLPVLTVQLNRLLEDPGPTGDDNWSIVREAQRQAAHDLANVTVTPALDLGLSDTIHNSPTANMLLADRVARAALGAVYGKDVDYLAPEPIRARRLNRDKVVEITFANVTSHLEPLDLTDQPFHLIDTRGVVPIEQARYPGGATVRLRLGRGLCGKAILHGAHGANPPVVPQDAARMMAMLGFYGLAVE